MGKKHPGYDAYMELYEGLRDKPNDYLETAEGEEYLAKMDVAWAAMTEHELTMVYAHLTKNNDTKETE